MLKAAEHEHEDWPVEPDELLRRALADLTHPDGDADEEVAEHAAQQRRAKGERRLHLRCRDNGIAHDVERPRRAAQPGDEHRAEEVPEVDERPAAQQRPQADLPLLAGQLGLVDDVQPLRGLVIADVLNVGHLPDRFIHSLPSSHIQNAVLFPGLVPQDSLIRIA